MQEGGMAQGPAVGQCRSPLSGVENQLNTAVFDGIHDVGATLQHLVDLDGVYPLFHQVTLGSRGGDGLKTEGGQKLDRRQNARLGGIFYGYEYRSAAGQVGTS